MDSPQQRSPAGIHADLPAAYFSADQPPCILAVDLGTSGCKTALVAHPGQILASAFQEIPTHILPEGGAEQNPDDWWAAFLVTARQVLREANVPAERILAVCCSAQGEGTVPVDRDGMPLGNAILWMDMRGASHVARNVHGPIRCAGYDVFALYRWIRLTGGAPALSGKDPAGHMLFIRDERPEVYARTYKFLNVLDYLNLRLTDRFVATYDSIVTSWVTDNRDPSRVRYNSRLIKASGIDANKLPEIVQSTQIIGTLVPELASELGLLPGTSVVAGAIDVMAAAVGAGTVDDYQPHLYVGTSAWIAAHVPWKKTNLLASIASLPSAVAGRYLMIGLQTTAGGNLAYLRKNILFHDDELQTHEGSADVYTAFDRMAARTPPGSHGLIYLPWLYGERCPVDDASLRAGLLNWSLNHTREDLVRAVMEGVALNTRWMLRSVNRFMRRQVPSLVMIGGGAKSSVWQQIFADVLNVSIRVPRDPLQSSLLGAAYIGAVGMGLMSFDDVDQHVEYGVEVHPDPSSRRVYDAHFRTFIEMHKRVKPVYRRLNRSQGAQLD